MARSGKKIINKALWLLFAFAFIAATSHAASPSTTTPKNISSLKDAKKAALGTWTHADPLTDSDLNAMNMGISKKFWAKVVFRADGTCSYFLANPSDDNWGNASKCNWDTGTDKYSNTGERYFCITLTGLDRDDHFDCDFIFNDSQRFEGNSRLSEFRMLYGRVFQKGNRFPFSK